MTSTTSYTTSVVYRFLSLLYVAVLGQALVAAPVRADNVPTIEGVSKQLDDAQNRLDVLDSAIRDSRRRRDAMTAQLAEVDARSAERSERIESLKTEIAHYERKLDRLDSAIAQEEAGVAERKQRLAQILDARRRIRRSTGLKVLLGHEDPALASRLGTYTEYLLNAQQALIGREKAALARLEDTREIALKDRNWLNYIKKKAEQQHLDLATESARHRQDLGTIREEIRNKSRTVAELKADSQRLQGLMEKLEAAAAEDSGYFAAGKGQYALPVQGVIEARFGETKSVGRVNWNGLFIRADAGAPVHAVADGEVVFADWLNGFGMLLILDHGDSYMTLYGGNRELKARQGTYIESGATIATVGDSGGQSSSGVYFEIRHNAKPIDPEPWVSAGNGA